ncbi:pancreatic secretory granule membrane major glycoprotein GP2-like [Bombina bombina]|uniref:pancreatic secretory granule membrane major glycoprotein GP2-like n=1 Tax=Bombina bombina TaxID=8345 RepID=UPI00235B2FC6|nr:pancreatic secretory granule membrane major glycoprotein GP2-like [Bombina bombina]
MMSCFEMLACVVQASLLFLCLTSAETDLEVEINETVICTKDLIEVEIPNEFFLAKQPPISISDLHLNDPECRGRETEHSYIFSIQTNFTDCGTLMASDDSHIVFINTIHSNSSDVVTRSYINITFSCRYPINYMVQQPHGENRISVDIRTITLTTEDGNFSVSMMLYKDKGFQDMWTTVPFLKLEDNIFVRVHMIPGHLIIRLEKCWATPTDDPSHPVQYTFIQDSCSHVYLDETMSIIMNGVGAEAMFRIQMFKFVGLAYNNVFLHCTVQICHNTEEICKPNCTKYRRVARQRRDISAAHTVTYGPISLKVSDDGASDTARGNSLPVETMVLIGVLTVVLAIAGVFAKLLFNSRRSYPTMQAQLTLANIHHSEVAS